jgi:cytochrome P450 family 3 subfamily A
MSYNLVKRLINLISGGNSENKTNYSPYSFMAFGSGPRNCVGMRFAMEELKIAISALVRQFRFFPVEETPVQISIFNSH